MVILVLAWEDISRKWLDVDLFNPLSVFTLLSHTLCWNAKAWFRLLCCIALYLSISIVLLTAWAFQKCSRLHHWHCVGVYMPKRYRPKVPAWRLVRDSSPQSSSRKASTLPLRHHAHDLCWSVLADCNRTGFFSCGSLQREIKIRSP